MTGSTHAEAEGAWIGLFILASLFLWVAAALLAVL